MFKKREIDQTWFYIALTEICYPNRYLGVIRQSPVNSLNNHLLTAFKRIKLVQNVCTIYKNVCIYYYVITYIATNKKKNSRFSRLDMQCSICMYCKFHICMFDDGFSYTRMCHFIH